MAEGPLRGAPPEALMLVRTVGCPLLLVLPLLLLLPFGADPAAGEERCTYRQTTYLGNHPREKSPGWEEAAQGITEDRERYWYITQNEPDRLWRIPFAHDLSQGVSCGAGGVACQDLTDVPFLVEEGYDHYGDPDYFEHEGQGYVFVPLEGFDAGATGAVAAFRAPSLEFAGIAFAHLPEHPNRLHAPWAAFDSAGYLYVSAGSSPSEAELLDPRKARKWKVDWERLDAGEGLHLLEAWDVTLLTPSPGTVCNPSFGLGLCLSTGVGGPPGELVELGLRIPQGADFSDDDRLLYVANGPGSEECSYFVLEDPDDPTDFRQLPGCGLHAFEVALEGSDAPCSSADGPCRAVRIDRSKNGSGPFNYQYNPGLVFNFEEPEGLTWFDLDAPDAPTIPGRTSASCVDPESGEVLDRCPVVGQLHAILLDVEHTAADDIYVKHYRVERDCEPTPQPGIRVLPRSHDFGDVPVGGVAALSVEIRNVGGGELLLESIRLLPSDAGYGIASAPETPGLLAPDATAPVEIRFAPSEEGFAAAVLEITSGDPDRPTVPVPLSGTAIGFPAQARALVDALDQGRAQGDLMGAGPGRSGPGRAGALRNMLVAAADDVESGRWSEACEQLGEALERADGELPPPDFVTGPAAPELASEIAGLRERLGCP